MNLFIGGKQFFGLLEFDRLKVIARKLVWNIQGLARKPNYIYRFDNELIAASQIFDQAHNYNVAATSRSKSPSR